MNSDYETSDDYYGYGYETSYDPEEQQFQEGVNFR